MRVPVESSNIKEIEFDPAHGYLDVHFLSGQSWRYKHATPALYQSFLDSPSKGKFFAQNIKKTLAGESLTAK